MREEDIRPQDLMLENQRLREEDAKNITKYKNEFVLVPCPACESNNYEFMFEKEDFSFVMCKDCETCFINPRPTIEKLAEFYENSKCLKHWKKFFSLTEHSRRKNIFEPRAERVIYLCKKYNVSNNVLADIGAGFGTFCEEIKKFNYFRRIIAIEPSKDLADACKRKGMDVIEKPIEKTDLEEVDVITNFELIEHLFHPKDFVISCARALSKNGLFILTTPNIKGFDLLTLGKLSTNIAGPNHMNYFHTTSLSNLLQKCGFDIIETLTPGKLDAELVRKKVLNKEFSIDNQPFLKYILIDEWERLGDSFQHFLSDHGLSSHLWIVARKK